MPWFRPHTASAPTHLGAVVGSLAAGAAWSWLYGLGAAGSAAVALGHVALGLGIGWYLALFRWRGPRGVALGLAAALVVAGLIPAFIGRFIPSTADTAAGHDLARVETRDGAAARVAIVGLDGADWSVIDPLLAAGDLPHLAGLVARGRTAVLRSIEPIESPVVWTSIFSGRPPEEHGIVGWTYAHAANRRTGALWEMLGAAGLASVVVNIPGTWPPTEVEGALISGFPIPSALRPARGDPRLAQNVGVLVPNRDVHDSVSIGGWIASSEVRHFAIDAAIVRGWLPIREVRIGLDRIEVARGAWSPWLTIRSPGGPLHVRIRHLDDGSLFVTPAFQDAGAPIRSYASSRAVQDLVAALGPYVVEPAGWKRVADPIARDAVFEHLVDVEEMHLRASLALREWRSDWRLFAHVVTLPDRVSHAFWRFHHPEDYPPIERDELAAHRDKVVRAYRESDRLLGQLLARLDSDTTVIVLSDHGFTSEGDRWGGHRLDGMLVAAGPGIAAGADRLALSIYHVVPLALTLLGLPVASDFAADVPTALIVPRTPVTRIASYETDTAGPTVATTIEQTTEEQLRGLGYVE
jgi:hypothetical protein